MPLYPVVPAAAAGVKLDDALAPDDNTDLNASTMAHGLMPKLTGSTTTFHRSDGSQAAPVITGTKTTALAALTGANAATLDLLNIVDVSDTTMDAAGTDKQITLAEFMIWARTNGPVRLFRQTASLTNASNTTPTDVPGIAFPVISGETYHFKYVGRYQTAATGTGIALTWSGPAITMASWSMFAQKAAATEGTTQATSWLSASQTMTTVLISDAVGVASTYYWIEVEGVVVPSAAGTFQLRMRSEANASNAILGTGGVLVVHAAG